MKTQKYFPKYLTNDQKVIRPERVLACFGCGKASNRPVSAFDRETAFLCWGCC